jgi:hypothetical protein
MKFVTIRTDIFFPFYCLLWAKSDVDSTYIILVNHIGKIVSRWLVPRTRVWGGRTSEGNLRLTGVGCVRGYTRFTQVGVRGERDGSDPLSQRQLYFQMHDLVFCWLRCTWTDLRFVRSCRIWQARLGIDLRSASRSIRYAEQVIIAVEYRSSQCVARRSVCRTGDHEVVHRFFAGFACWVDR